MLCREVANFRARYPELIRSKGLGHQLVQNVLAVMRLRYGARFGVSPEGCTPLIFSENA
jgi:hypothetical protein